MQYAVGSGNEIAIALQGDGLHNATGSAAHRKTNSLLLIPCLVNQGLYLGFSSEGGVEYYGSGLTIQRPSTQVPNNCSALPQELSPGHPALDQDHFLS